MKKFIASIVFVFCEAVCFLFFVLLFFLILPFKLMAGAIRWAYRVRGHGEETYKRNPF